MSVPAAGQTQGQRDIGSEGHQEFPKLEGRVGVLGSKPELDVRWNVLLRTQSQASSLLYQWVPETFLGPLRFPCSTLIIP